MKKIFTLVIALGLFIVADAQPGHSPRRNNSGIRVTVNTNNGFRFGNNNLYISREIAGINQKYDHKIRHIQMSHMRPAKKARKIHALEHQRQMEINRVYDNARYSGNRYGYSPRRF